MLPKTGRGGHQTEQGVGLGTLAASSERPAILRYGMALVSIIAAVGALWFMTVRLQAAAGVSLFLIAVLVSTWFGGAKPGLLAIVLSGLAFTYFFLPPISSFAIETNHIPRLLLFVVLAIFVLWLVLAERAAVDQTRESQALLGLVTDNMDEQVHLFDTAGRVIYANASAARFKGQARPDFVNCFGAEDRGLAQRWFERALTGSKEFLYAQVTGVSGERRWLEIQGTVGSYRGAPHLVTVCRDVTERKRAEEALRRSKDELRLIIDTIPAMVFATAPDGPNEFANKRWLEYTGMKPGQERGYGWLEAFHPDDRAVHFAKWRAALEKGELFESVARTRRTDGEYRWFLTQAMPLRDESGKIVRWYGTTVDIEERKRAEQEVQQSHRQLRALMQRLRSAREEEGIRIAREIHDEMGQSLTGLKMDLNSLQKQNGETDQTRVERKQKLREMSTAIDRTIEAVHRICAELRPGVLDELGLIAALEGQARDFEARTGIFCNLLLPAEDPPLTREAATAVFRIFQEVLTNVARHAEATEVDVSLTTAGDILFLRVHDNGHGLTQEALAVTKGLGWLGMRERALAAGGTIQPSTESGSGTTIELRLPLLRKKD